VVASVTVLQTLHNLSDREVAGAVTFDLRWKAACGNAIDVAGFHPTALARRRLADSERPPRIFEVVREVITQTGAIEGKQRRALDSTILDDAVARQDIVIPLIAASRRAGRDVAGAKDLVAMRWSTMRLPCWTRSTSNCSRRQAGSRPMRLLLALVAGQDVEPAKGSDGTHGRWRIARKTAPDRTISIPGTPTRPANASRTDIRPLSRSNPTPG
jgi:hypothetical protein